MSDTPEDGTTDPMSLDDAISLLCRVHLRDMEQDGWAVMMGATPFGWEREYYVPAWEVLRDHIMKARERETHG